MARVQRVEVVELLLSPDEAQALYNLMLDVETPGSLSDLFGALEDNL